MVSVLGIDPGLSGAIASFDGSTLVCWPIPSVKARGRGREIDLYALNALYPFFESCDAAYLEQVNARPGEGRSSAFKFGTGYGEIQMLCMSWYSKPPVFVTPQKWKKHFKLGKEKDEAVALAVKMFPASESMFFGPRGGVLDGPAEASLIAVYGFEMENAS